MPNNSRVKTTADDIRERLLQASASAFQTLLELLENAETDTVRLRAAQDILDRAGFKPVDKREVSGVSSVVNTSVDYSDPAAVAARITELKKRLEEAKSSCSQVKDDDRQVN
jgi:DNA-binding ferritin-like protein